MRDITTVENTPLRELGTKVRKNCVATPSMLVVTGLGLDRYCYANFFSNWDRLRVNFVGVGSIVKNGLSVAPRNGPFHFVFNPWGTGYYHWITEIATKFLLFEKELRSGFILVPRDLPDFIKDFLTAFGFDSLLKIERPTFFSELKMYENQRHGHHFRPHLELLRERVYDRYGIDQPKRRRRVYVSRSDAKIRKVVNESEVIESLLREGFEVLRPEHLSFADQVRVFSECETLVSIHGAALANSIFMQPGGRVIELYPHDGGDPCFRLLNHEIGNSHEYLFCERANPTEPFSLRENDLIVDTGALFDRL